MINKMLIFECNLFTFIKIKIFNSLPRYNKKILKNQFPVIDECTYNKTKIID